MTCHTYVPCQLSRHTSLQIQKVKLSSEFIIYYLKLLSPDLTTIETSALNSSNVEQAFTDLLSMTYSVMCKVISTMFSIVSFKLGTNLTWFYAQETLQGASPSVTHRQDIIELSNAARSSTRKCCD